jgi:hypothetical protein
VIKNDDPVLWDFWQDKNDPVRRFQSGFAESAIRQYPGLWEYLSMKQEEKQTEMKISELNFQSCHTNDDDILHTAQTDVGRITVLDRLTGFGDGTIRDIETGYRDLNGNFWLVSGDIDIRCKSDISIDEAILYIKENATTFVKRESG